MPSWRLAASRAFSAVDTMEPYTHSSTRPLRWGSSPALDLRGLPSSPSRRSWGVRKSMGAEGQKSRHRLATLSSVNHAVLALCVRVQQQSIDALPIACHLQVSFQAPTRMPLHTHAPTHLPQYVAEPSPAGAAATGH